MVEQNQQQEINYEMLVRNMIEFSAYIDCMIAA